MDLDMETAVYSDAAKRVADEMTMHAVLGQHGKWCAFRLSDGSSPDHAAYDSRADAVRHQKSDADRCMYLQIAEMPADHAEQVLDFWRKAHDAGLRGTDPEVLMPLTAQDRKRQITALRKS
jgi:hypothetical protein